MQPCFLSDSYSLFKVAEIWKRNVYLLQKIKQDIHKATIETEQHCNFDHSCIRLLECSFRIQNHLDQEELQIVEMSPTYFLLRFISTKIFYFTLQILRYYMFIIIIILSNWLKQIDNNSNSSNRTIHSSIINYMYF